MVEEEARRKAEVKRARYAGPMLRVRSGRRTRTEGEGDNEEDGRLVVEEELTTLEVRNMQPPAWLQPQVAPAPVQRVPCVITGKPAKYRDPVTGLAYADLEAYKELQARRRSQMAPMAGGLAAMQQSGWRR
jgi:vacuolar protein sorting-associated protein 72